MPGPVILHDLRLPLGHPPAELVRLIAQKSGRSEQTLGPRQFRIIRRSIDARHKSTIFIQYSIELDPEPLKPTGIASLCGKPGRSAIRADLVTGLAEGSSRPVVAGAGPAGLFAALYLAMAGRRPILIEQGKPVEKRRQDVIRYWETASLDPLSNVQFGEGGAGAFSDGKLTTGIKDNRCTAILEELVLAGAPEDILFLAKPHIGTDYLQTVVRNLRQKIIQFGGDVFFQCRLAGLELNAAKDRLCGIVVELNGSEGSQVIQEWPASQLILAIGHSSRETYRWLGSLPLQLTPKAFSLGLRIEHPQVLIDEIQYGRFAGHPQLPPADYKLAVHLPGGRSVYTFCMCPGGQVIAAASQPASVVTNGMSLYARDLPNANSALLVGIQPDDFLGSGPLRGMYWQEEIEQAAYILGGRNGRAPVERLGSFLARGKSEPHRQGSGALAQKAWPADVWPAPAPTYRPGVAWCELDACLPDMICVAIREAIPQMDQNMPGFMWPEAILTGVETRSSSPVRIPRGQTLQSSVGGIYPCGEGAGQAGGIMSAAADGLRCAEALCSAI